MVIMIMVAPPLRLQGTKYKIVQHQSMMYNDLGLSDNARLTCPVIYQVASAINNEDSIQNTITSSFSLVFILIRKNTSQLLVLYDRFDFNLNWNILLFQFHHVHQSMINQRSELTSGSNSTTSSFSIWGKDKEFCFLFNMRHSKTACV